MNYILFDGIERNHLLPLAFTRPVSAFRIGILTIHEKWEKHLNTTVSCKSVPYLAVKYPLQLQKNNDNIWINSSYCPSSILVNEIINLLPGQALVSNNNVIAINSGQQHAINPLDNRYTKERITTKAAGITKLNHLWDIFSHNGSELIADYTLITQNRHTQAINVSNRMVNPENIFVEAGAQLEYTILNASAGPIYIGKNAQIMENTVIRGPFALCEGATVKIAAKVYGATTIGPYSTIGGEVKNSVIFGYSNKGHDGYLGNSVIGEWCNMGAGSNNSNLKNNYASVKLWNYANKCYENTNQQFCGLFMADYSNCSINTMFNTGTVIGVNTNVFDAGFPEKFIPDFTWSNVNSKVAYDLEKALQTAERGHKLKGKVLTAEEKNILTEIYKLTHF